MKQNSGISGQLAVGLIIFSLVFSACSSTSTQNGAKLPKAKFVIFKREYDFGQFFNDVEQFGNERADVEQTAFMKKANERRKIRAIDENPFLETSRAPLSTFSIDVDTASYANVRRYFETDNFRRKMPCESKNSLIILNTITAAIGDAVFGDDEARLAWNRQTKIVSIGLQEKQLSWKTRRRRIWYLWEVFRSDAHAHASLVNNGLPYSRPSRWRK
jgi:hypothetical protein